jgi:hypothetical protein
VKQSRSITGVKTDNFHVGYKYKKIEGGVVKVFITNQLTGETVPLEEWKPNDPYTFFSIEQLQHSLKYAISVEDYEDAAIIKKHLDFKTQQHGS